MRRRVASEVARRLLGLVCVTEAYLAKTEVASFAAVGEQLQDVVDITRWWLRRRQNQRCCPDKFVMYSGQYVQVSDGK